MAQLQLEAEEDEPDSTVIGKALERTKETAEDTISDALKTALKRLGAYIVGFYIEKMLGSK
jgi:hypothetical protein